MNFRNICFMVIVSFLFVCGCAKNREISFSSQPMDYGQSCSRQYLKRTIANLQRHRVQVVFLGDHIFLAIPSDKIFNEESVHLNMKRVYILDLVADFLRCYQKVFVQVKVNNGRVGSEQGNLNFSRLRARNVVDYLWEKGIKTQLIYGKGTNELKIDVQGRKIKEVEIITQKLP